MAKASENDGHSFDNLLREIYFNPKLSGSFSGVKSLYDAAKLENDKIRLKDVRNFLERQSTYVDFRDVRRKFKRRMYVSGFCDNIWGLDICFFTAYKKMNFGYTCCLVVVDFFSRLN